MADCVCMPEAVDGWRYVPWIGKYFNDCVYTPYDMIAFAAGMGSLLIFFISMVPQWIKNYQRKRVDGLSIHFLVIWVVADLLSLFGAFFTDQIPTVKAAAIYFIVSDIFTLWQYFYYLHVYPRISKKAGNRGDELEQDFDGEFSKDNPLSNLKNTSVVPKDNEHKKSFDNDQGDFTLNRNDANLSSLSEKQQHSTINMPNGMPSTIAYSVAIMSVMMTAINATSPIIEPVICDAPLSNSATHQYIGIIFAWISGTLYFLSRIPQIIENYRLKEVEGLSIALFILTISGNFLYGMGIILRFPELNEKFYQSTMPYLYGSMGTFVFDIAIIYQAFLYTKPSSDNVIGRIKAKFIAK